MDKEVICCPRCHSCGCEKKKIFLKGKIKFIEYNCLVCHFFSKEEIN